MKTELLEFFSGKDPELIGGKNDLAEALYSFGELDLFLDDVDSVGKDQAFLVWRIVEKLRKEKLPENLRM